MKRTHKKLDREPELPNVGTSEQEPTFCDNGPLDGLEDDDDEEEGHEELDGAP